VTVILLQTSVELVRSNISKRHEVDLTPLAVGIDSLYVSCFCDGLGFDWEALAFEKEKLRTSPATSYTEIEFGGERFALHRGGCKPYSYMLSNKAFTLRLGERVEPKCYVQLRSEVLWTSGLETALSRLDGIWRQIGTTQKRPPTVSRVDTAFDFAIGKPDFDIDCFTSRATKDATWRENRSTQTLHFGTSDVVCRVYDKVAEIEQVSGKTWMFDIWGTREGVWRAEFQIRDGRLRKAGIATLDQLRAHLPGLVKELAERHTTLRRPSGDSNRSRWPLHPMWEGLVGAVDQLISPPERTPPPLICGSEFQLALQMRSILGDLKGIAATLSAGRGGGPPTLGELIVRLPRLLAPYHQPDLWRADVAEKIRKRELGL
jgi:hypothetical protein